MNLCSRMKLWSVSVFVINNTAAIVELNNCFITFCRFVYQVSSLSTSRWFSLVRLQGVA